jgi:hypothetical protein
VALPLVAVEALDRHLAIPGVTTKELMARIGHASPGAALIYQHATAEHDQLIADYLDEQIAAAKTASNGAPETSVTPLRRG